MFLLSNILQTRKRTKTKFPGIEVLRQHMLCVQFREHRDPGMLVPRCQMFHSERLLIPNKVTVNTFLFYCEGDLVLNQTVPCPQPVT